MRIKYLSEKAKPKPLSTGQALALELLYWLARLLSTYAVWLLTAHIFIGIAIKIRGYCDVGGEYLVCVMASFIWFCLFKVLIKGEDKT